MTETERFLIDLLSSHISGTAPRVPENTDYAALTSLAHIHKLTPIVYSTLSKYCRESVPEDYLSSLKRTAMMQMTSPVSRSRAFLDVYGKLSDAGIKCSVVKGLALRVLYPEPDLRLSSDDTLSVGERVVVDYLDGHMSQYWIEAYDVRPD